MGYGKAFSLDKALDALSFNTYAPLLHYLMKKVSLERTNLYWNCLRFELVARTDCLKSSKNDLAQPLFPLDFALLYL